MAETATIQQLESRSVQALPDAEKGNTTAFQWFPTARGFILPAWGTRQREYALRRMYLHEYNYMGQSAITGLIAKIASTKWTIKANRRVEYFSDVLRNADFYRGWTIFLSKFLRDYLTLDGGAYAEIIAPGNPKRPPTGAVIGLAALDALQCQPTGDPEFPVIYTNNNGQMRLMHYSRVLHMVDSPTSDARNPGYGLCALSRAASVVAREIYMGRYVETKLDDKPAPGYTIFNNINKAEYDALLAKYRIEQGNDERPEWGSHINVFGMAPDRPVDVRTVTMSQAPEAWSFVDFTQLDVNAWALALGVDVQELWQLSGGNLGSGSQSEILHAKSQGKTQALIYQTLSRLINYLLPDSAEFSWELHDPFQAQSDANIAQLWAGFVSSVSMTLSKEEQRRFLANKVEAYADVVTDEKGEVIVYTDQAVDNEPVDVSTNGVQSQGDTAPANINPTDEAVAGSEGNTPASVDPAADGKPTARPASQPAPVQQQSVQQTPPQQLPAQLPTTNNPVDRGNVVDAMNAGLITIGQAQEALGLPVDPEIANMYMHEGVPVPKEVLLQLYETQFGRGVNTFTNALEVPPPSSNPSKSFKAIQSTQLDFENDWADLVDAAREDEMTRRRFGIVARALITKYGRRAYEDGLEVGGIEDAELDDSDRAEILSLTAQQSAYVTAIGQTLFKGDGITDIEAANKPTLWFNKSITPFFDAGLVSADKNGLYEWVYGDTEHCDDCQRLNGQKHRLKDYYVKGWLPKASTLKCGGYNCACQLKRTTGRAQGSY